MNKLTWITVGLLFGCTTLDPVGGSLVAVSTDDRVMCVKSIQGVEKVIVRAGEADAEHFSVIWLERPELGSKEYRLHKSRIMRSCPIICCSAEKGALP